MESWLGESMIGQKVCIFGGGRGGMKFRENNLFILILTMIMMLILNWPGDAYIVHLVCIKHHCSTASQVVMQ